MRASLIAIPVLLLATIVGCSSGSAESEDLVLPETTESESSDESGDEAEEIAELEKLFLVYYDAIVEMENAKELDPSLLDGIANDLEREEEVARLHPFKEYGVTGKGEPTFTNDPVEVDGDRAEIPAYRAHSLVRLALPVDTSGEYFGAAVPRDPQQFGG
jgi:hypothetical protein